jgi:DNA-binding transcriptional regulator YdaS (Cro superfamily)
MHPIKHYCKSNGIRVKDFAGTIGYSPGYISQVITGFRNPSAWLCLKVEKATAGAIRKEALIFWHLN